MIDSGDKYVSAETLITTIEGRIESIKSTPFSEAKIKAYNDCISIIKSFKQSEGVIDINGIKYKEVPAKTNDKICKDCDYFLDNGVCTLDDCPCSEDNILERVKEQPEVDIEKEIEEHAENMPHGEFTHDSECVEHEEWAKSEFRHFYELGLSARKEE